MTATLTAERTATADVFLPSIGRAVESETRWSWLSGPTDFTAAGCHGVLRIGLADYQCWIADRDDDGRRHTVIDLEKLGTLAGRVLARCRVVVGPDGQAVCDCEDGRSELRCRHAACCRAAVREWEERVAAEQAAALKAATPADTDPVTTLGFEF
jgi:hypothetical protein